MRFLFSPDTVAFSEFWKGYIVGAILPVFFAPLVGRPITNWIANNFPWRVRVERRQDAKGEHVRL